MTIAAKDQAPDSLKFQWRLLGLVLRSNWATGLDKSVAFEIIDNYRKDRGNSRASLRYLSEATGADRTNVISSVRRLVENGPFSVLRQGVGTRPTEYQLHFDAAQGPASGVASTTASENASGVVDTTACGVVETTASLPSGVVQTTESVLPVTAYKAGLQSRIDIDSAGATPPPAAAALGAAPAVPSEEERYAVLFKAYGVRLDYAGGLAAFRAAAPSADDYAEMLGQAAAWRASWQAGGGEKTGRRRIKTWLEKKDYLCDPPQRATGKPTKARPAPKASRVAANDNLPPVAKVAPVRAIFRQRVTVENAEDVTTTSGQLIRMHLKTEAGELISHDLVWEHRDAKVQEAGQHAIVRLAAVTGKDSVDDAACLRGCSFVYTGRMGAEAYEVA